MVKLNVNTPPVVREFVLTLTEEEASDLRTFLGYVYPADEVQYGSNLHQIWEKLADTSVTTNYEMKTRMYKSRNKTF